MLIAERCNVTIPSGENPSELRGARGFTSKPISSTSRAGYAMRMERLRQLDSEASCGKRSRSTTSVCVRNCDDQADGVPAIHDRLGFIRYAREQGIRSDGPGSAAGTPPGPSITDVDPLYYDLIFERSSIRSGSRCPISTSTSASGGAVK